MYKITIYYRDGTTELTYGDVVSTNDRCLFIRKKDADKIIESRGILFDIIKEWKVQNLESDKENQL